MSDQASGRKRQGVSLKGERFPKRTFGIRLIGAYVPRVTQPAFRKKSPLLTRLMLDWEQFVGNALFRVSEPKRLQQGVLTISCQGPMGLELQYNAPQILNRINTSCGLAGEHKLTQLKIVQDRIMSPPAERVFRARVEPQPIEGFEDGPLKEALERLGGRIQARAKR